MLPCSNIWKNLQTSFFWRQVLYLPEEKLVGKVIFLNKGLASLYQMCWNFKNSLTWSCKKKEAVSLFMCHKQLWCTEFEKKSFMFVFYLIFINFYLLNFIYYFFILINFFYIFYFILFLYFRLSWNNFCSCISEDDSQRVWKSHLSLVNNRLILNSYNKIIQMTGSITMSLILLNDICQLIYRHKQNCLFASSSYTICLNID